MFYKQNLEYNFTASSSGESFRTTVGQVRHVAGGQEIRNSLEVVHSNKQLSEILMLLGLLNLSISGFDYTIINRRVRQPVNKSLIEA